MTQYADRDEPLIDQMSGVADGEFADDRYGRVSSGTTEPNLTYINESGLRDEELEAYFNSPRGRRFYQEAASVIEKWSQSLTSSSDTPTLDVFRRRKLDRAKHIHAQMAQCAWAVEHDDILSTTADVIEGLMWQKCRFELFDEDQQDMWNQWAADVDLDGCLRQMGREEFKVSQFYVGLWWERTVYQVQDNEVDATLDEFEAEGKQREYEKKVEQRDAYVQAHQKEPGFIMPPEVPKPPDNNPGPGNRRRRKKFPVTIPTGVTIFDPTKVLPVGTLMFGRERFAYIASRDEDAAFGQVMRGEIADGTVLQLIERKYAPTPADRAACADLGVDPSRLWLFKEDAIFRHTLTRAHYERYASIRLKSVLPILEMKDHLRASDRATLIGNTNFIVVIKKGTDRLPARPAEIANLQEQAKTIARLPVLIGDHRLSVEIVSPTTDHTLQQSRWEVLDARLVFTALRSYAPVVQGGNSSGTGVSEMSRVISKGLENRRHMVVRSLEKHIFKKVLDKNQGVLDEMPSLAFTPKRISLDFKSDIIQQILKLRDRGDLSRETMLEELDYDQEVEVLRRASERVRYDEVFESQVPYSTPVTNPFGPPVLPEGMGNPPAPSPPPGGGQQPPAKPGNVGPSGQPRTEGGRPPGATDAQTRAPRGSKKQ